MNKKLASQIAELINNRNQLNISYTSESILKDSENYEYEVKDDVVIACVEIKRIQWYQWELRHLSVSPDHERKGYARMINRAETKAIKGRAKIIQCTIRKGNQASENIFEKNDYKKTVTFYNPFTDNDVTVWQKIVSKRPHISNT